MRDGASIVDMTVTFRYAGLPPEDEQTVVGRGGGVDRGSLVEVYLRARGAVIEQARFLAFGAPAVFTCAAAACEALTGMPAAEARTLTGQALAERAGVGAQALGDALVVEDAVKAALDALN